MGISNEEATKVAGACERGLRGAKIALLGQNTSQRGISMEDAQNNFITQLHEDGA